MKLVRLLLLSILCAVAFPAFAQLNIGAVDPGPYSPGSTIAATFSIDPSTCIAQGNVFSLRLSDASGNFTPGVVIGTYNSFYSTFVNGIIPIGTPVGVGYRLRIESSAPGLTTADSNPFVIGIGAPVEAKITSAPISASNAETFGLCSGKNNNNFALTNESTAGSIVSATIKNEISGGAPTVLSFPTQNQIFSAGLAHYTVVTTAIMGDGRVATKAYFIINNQTVTAFSTSGNNVVCLPQGALEFSVDYTGTSGIQKNFPGDTYVVNWGDLTTTTYTLCDIIQSGGKVSHVYIKSSCGNVFSGSSGTEYNVFAVNISVENPFCGKVGSAISSTAKVIAKPQNSFTTVTPSCTNTPVTFVNTSVQGEDPSTNSAGCVPNVVFYNWFVDGVLVWANRPISDNLVHTFTTHGSHTVRIESVSSGTCDGDPFEMVICIQDPPKPSFTLPIPTICSGGSVTPINTSIIDNICDNTVNYSWSVSPSAGVTYGGGTNSSSAQPQFIFANTGIYQLTLSVSTPSCGSYVTLPQTVVVNEMPTASLSPNAALCSVNTYDFNPTTPGPTRTTFSGTSSELATTYTWTVTGGAYAFVGGSNPNTKYPSIQFLDYTTYTVSVTHTNSCGSVTVNQTISFTPAPTVNAGTDQSICFNDIVNLSGSVTGTTLTRTWIGGSGTFSPDRNTLNATYTPSAAEQAAGQVTLTLRATTSLPTPCDVINDDIIITIKPIVTVNSANSKSICTGTNVAYNPTSATVGSTFAWTATGTANAGGFTTSGTGNINDVLTNSSPTSNATVTYTITPTGNGCVGVPFTFTVTITPNPILTPTPANLTICSGQGSSITLASNLPNTKYTWTSTSTAGILGNTSNPTPTSSNTINDILFNNTNTSGTVSYTITPISDEGCPGTPVTITLTVEPQPTTPNAGVDEIICNVTSYTFKGNQPIVGTGLWTQVTTFPGVTFTNPNLFDGVVNGLVPGNTYVFRWTITGAASCSPKTDDVAITINPLSIGGTTAGSITVCADGNTGVITLSGHTGNVVRWESSIDGGVTYPDIINNTTTSLSYNNLTTTTYFRAIVQSGVCAPAISSASIITVNQPVNTSNAGSDQVLCNATSATLNGNLPTNPNTGTWTLTSGQTGVTFANAALANTLVNGLVAGQSYTFRWTISGSAPCPPSIDEVTITIDLPSNGGITTGSTAVCAGNSNAQITVSGYVGNIVRWESSTDNFATVNVINTTQPFITYTNLTTTTQYRAVVKNGTCGEALSTVATVTVNQGAVAAAAGPDQDLCNVTSTVLGGNDPLTNTGLWTLTSGQTGVTFVDASKFNTAVNGLVGGQTYVFRWTISGLAPCPASSDDVTINVNLPSNGGTTAGNTAVCAGNSNGQITISGFVGNIVRWESSTDNFVTTTIINTTLSAINYTNLTTTTQYRAVVKNGTCAEAASTIATVTVNQGAVAAAAGPDQDLCNVTSTALGGNDPLTNTGLWTLTSGQTGVTFVDASKFNTAVNGLVGGQTYVFRWTISGLAPCPASSDDVTINVNLPSNGGTTAGNTAVCAGNSNGQITVSGFVGNIVRWESSTDNFVTTTIINTTLSAINYTNLTTTTQYRAVVKNGTCAEAASTIATITVNQGAVGAAAGPDQDLCSVTSTVLAGNDPLTNVGSWALISGQTGVTFADASKFNTAVNGLVGGQTYIFRWTISGIAPCPASSDDIVVTNLSALQNNNIATPVTTNCTGQVITLTGGLPTGGNGTYTYIWQSSPTGAAPWTPIAGQTSRDLNVNVSSSLSYRRIVNSGVCTTTSNIITITALPPIANNTIAADQTICLTTTPNTVTGSQPTGGDGNNYSYSWEQSTDNGNNWSVVSGINTPTYSPPAITQTTLYRRLVASSVCSGSSQSVSNIIKITVNLNARAEFTYTNDLGCNPYLIDANNIKAVPYPAQNATYTWYADGVVIGTGITFPGYTIATGNTSVVIKLVTTSSLGCLPSEMSHTFSTRPNVAASFTQSATVGCGPLSVTFTNTTSITAGFTFEWRIENTVISTSADPGTLVFQADPAGEDKIYNISLRVTTPCGSTTSASTVTVRPRPVAAFLPSKTIGCSPLTVVFKNTSPGSNTTYSYDFDDGTTSPATTSKADVSHTFITDVVRDFTVKMTATNECGTDTKIIIIRVSPNTITPALVVNGNQMRGCAPFTVDFINNTKGASRFTYTFEPGVVVTANTVQTEVRPYTFTKAGTYTVTMVAENDCSTASAQVTVVVDPQPTISFKGDFTTGCVGLTVKFTKTSTDAVSYLWDFGDGSTSNAADPTHTYSGPAAQHDVTLTAFNSLGCPTVLRMPNYVTTVDPPNAAFAISPAAVISIPNYTFKFTDESSNRPQTYKWSFGDGDFSSQKDPSHTYRDTGTYLVTMRTFNEFGCADSLQKYVHIVGVPGYVYVPNSFIPGGTSSELQTFIALGSGIKSWKMQVFNKWGQVLWETTKLNDGKPVEGWDGNYKGVPQPQGIYFWKIDVQLVNGTEWKGMTFGKSAPKRTGEIYLIR